MRCFILESWFCRTRKSVERRERHSCLFHCLSYVLLSPDCDLCVESTARREQILSRKRLSSKEQRDRDGLVENPKKELTWFTFRRKREDEKSNENNPNPQPTLHASSSSSPPLIIFFFLPWLWLLFLKSKEEEDCDNRLVSHLLLLIHHLQKDSKRQRGRQNRSLSSSLCSLISSFCLDFLPSLVFVLPLLLSHEIIASSVPWVYRFFGCQQLQLFYRGI